MFSVMLAAAIAAPPAAGAVGYPELLAGRDDAAITVISRQEVSDDPAKLINLGVAYARKGDTVRARAMFRAAHNAEERVDLETAAGEWVYSRVLARRGLAMLDNGDFSRAGALALK